LNGNGDVDIQLKNNYAEFTASHFRGQVGFIAGNNLDCEKFTLNLKQDGAIFIFSNTKLPVKDSNQLILVFLSEVKNAEGGWKNGKYIWGSSTPILKKTNFILKPLKKGVFSCFAIERFIRESIQLVGESKDENEVINNCQSKTPCYMLGIKN
jgi:hypothetical protein